MATPTPPLLVVRDGNRLVLSGPLGFGSARSGLAQLPTSLEDVETIELAGVTHADSAGLALLVECLKRAGSRPPALRSAPPQLLALARAMALSSLFSVSPD